MARNAAGSRIRRFLEAHPRASAAEIARAAGTSQRRVRRELRRSPVTIDVESELGAPLAHPEPRPSFLPERAAGSGAPVPDDIGFQ